MNQTSRKKEEADKLLQSVKEKAKNPRQIQLKGFHIAGLYAQAKEYRTAFRHAQDYLAVKPNDARAHRLLGEICECLGDVQKAIQSYRRASELNETQKDVVLKVAELYCRVKRDDYDAERHRYWAERAEKYFPGNPKIYAIMEHIYRQTGKLNDFKTYLQQKMRSRPQDLILHLQLLQVLMELKKLKEAQQLCVQVEGARLFDQELLWWKKTVKLYEMLLSRMDDGDQSEDHIITFGHMLISINNLVRITLSVHNTAVAQASKLLKIMDKELFRACDYVDSSPSSREQSGAQTVLQEMKAQLYTHLATLLVKMAATGSARWADVIGLVTACYLVSAQVPSCQETRTTSSSTTRGDRSGDGSSNMNRRMHSLAQCRLSEVCHILTSIVKQQKNERWLKQCHETLCSEEGRQQILSQAFGQGGLDPTSSFLVMDDGLTGASFTELPSLIKTVFLYDQESIKSEPASLQRLVWLGLQWDVRPDGILPDLGQFLQPVFSRLLFSTQHLENTSVDNIRLLDIEAFLYGCVHVAKAQQDQLQARGQILPKTLPLGLCRGMCSSQQLEWYSALYTLYTAKASPNERAKLRLGVQKGLEVLRCRMNHGMETSLLIRLGRTFGQRMQEVQQSSDGVDNRDQWSGFQQMSVMYWQAALEHLHLLARNQAVPTQQKPFFPYGTKQIPLEKIPEYQDEGTVAVAQHKFQQGQFQQAVAMLDKTKSANGSYLKAQMYLTKAQTEAEGQGLEIISSPLTRQGELLDKAKHALFDTMDSIQNQPDNPLHEQIQTSLMEIDDQQATLSHEVAALEEEEATAAGDTLLGSLNNSRNRSGLSDIAPFESAGNDPSPRRLAAELRSLNLSHGRLMEENAQLCSLAKTHGRIMEQNQQLIDKQNTLMESNNALMKQVLELNMKFQELSTAQANKAAATPPPPPPPPQPFPDITSNRPIIISAAECKIDNPNFSASQLGGYPIMTHGGLASPMPGVASPMHGLPATGLYHHPLYGYYSAPQAYGLATAGAYETPGLHPSLITSTPAMHAARFPGVPQYMFEDPTSPTEAESPTNIPLPVGTSTIDVQPSTAFRGGIDAQPTGQADTLNFGTRFKEEAPVQVTSTAFRGGIDAQPTGQADALNFFKEEAPVQVNSEPNVSRSTTSSVSAQTPAKAAGGQEATSSSPLLLSMLMDKQEDSTKGSITAGTPPQYLTPTPSKPSIVAPTTHSILPKDPNATSTPGHFSGGKASHTGINSGHQQAFATVNPTSATAALSNFSFKPSHLSSTGLAQPSTPVTPAATSVKTTSQSPFAGFSFGHIQTTSSATPSTGFGFNSVGGVPSLSFRSVAKPSESLQKEVNDDDDDDDDVIFVSEKIPTPDQRARAEALFLPPTFFLCEDEPPCPGCPGCEPEDLASRRKTQHKSIQPAAVLDPSPPTVFGSVASAQQTFGVVAKTTPASVANETPTVFGTQETRQTSSIFGGGETSNLSFANITVDRQGTFTGASAKSFTFAQAGAPVFGAAAGGATGGGEQSHDHDPHYDAIMTLPELVQVKTGEEDEEIMYKQRARLYRFDKDLGVWKERGIGEVKLLRHKQSGALRLIMRREQVLKLCANHRVTPDMKLDPLQSSDRSWVWHALDYSDDDPSHEQLAIKFKTPDLAHEFKRRLEELQAARREEESEAERKTEEATAVGVTKEAGMESEQDAVGGSSEPDQKAATDDIFTKFKNQAGDWQCDACLLNNTADVTACQACNTPKPGSALPTGEPSSLAGNSKFGEGGGFKFGSSDGSAKPDFKFGGIHSEPDKKAATDDIFTKFKNQAGDWQCDACLLNNTADVTACPACNTPKPGSAPPTGEPSSLAGNSKFGEGGGFKFGSSDGSAKPDFKFGGINSETDQKAATDDIFTKFKNKAGDWQCDACLLNNTADVTACQACNTPKPGSAPPTGVPSSLAGNSKFGEGGGFKFGSSDGSAKPDFKFVGINSEPDQKAATDDIFTKFKNQTGDWQCDACLLNNTADVTACPACNTPKPGSAPPTGVPSSLTGNSKFGEGGGFKFGSSDGSAKPDFKFGGIHSFTSATSLSTSGSSLSTRMPKVGATQSDTVLAGGVKASLPAGPTSKFMFESGFQKFDFGGAGDKAPPPIASVQKPSTGYTFGANELTPPKAGGAADTAMAASPMVAVQNQSAGYTFGATGLTPPKAGGAADTAVAASFSVVRVTPVKPAVGFVFGSNLATPASTANPTPTATPTPKPKEDTPKGFSFADIAKSKGSSFSFRLNVSKIDVSSERSPHLPVNPKSPKPKSPGLVKSPGFNKSGDDEYYRDDEGDHIHFEPVVELPEFVEVKTGEEEEMVKFSHRAKLYRFDKETSQWKERGLGDIKLLYNPANKKYRILMRRDQVLKVCANHYITSELDLKSNAGSTKSWVWMAMDASEDEVQMEQLAVKFKTEETAREFKKAVDAAKEDIKKEGKEHTKEEAETDKEKENDQGKDGSQAMKEVEEERDQDDNAGSKTPDTREAEGDVDDDDNDEDYEDIDDDDDDYEDVDDDDDVDEEQIEDEDQQIQDGDEQVEDGEEQVEDKDQQVKNKDQQVKDKDEQVEVKNQQVEVGDQQVEDRDQQVEDRDLQREDKDPQVEDRDPQVEVKDQQVEVKDQQVEVRDQQVEDRDQQVEDRDLQVEDRDPQVEDRDPQVEVKDQQVEVKDQQVEVKDQQVEDRDPQVEDRDPQVEDKDPQVEDKDPQVEDKDPQVKDEDGNKEQEQSTEESDAGLPIAKSCDPNITKAFSELLRSANARYALKPMTEEASLASLTDHIGKEEDATAGAGSKDDSVSEERDDIHFEPVAHLPEQTEKVTGEEGQKLLFCSRSKLYRYDKDTAQWKDRGIGDIKILHNTKTKKYRIIMRRDQVFRVCANHYITKEMSLAPNAGSENSLVWQAMDVSDDKPQMEELAVRFKLAGTTQRFKTVFEDCQAELRKQAQRDEEATSTLTESQEEQKESSENNEQLALSTPTASESPSSSSESSSSSSSVTSSSTETSSTASDSVNADSKN